MDDKEIMDYFKECNWEFLEWLETIEDDYTEEELDEMYQQFINEKHFYNE